MFSINRRSQKIVVQCVRTNSSHTKIIHRDTSTWYIRGIFGRFCQPAQIDLRRIAVFSAVWTERIELWRYNNAVHRLSGPAYLKRQDDKIIEEIWFYKGKIHRSFGPAHSIKNVFTWYTHGEIMFS